MTICTRCRNVKIGENNTGDTIPEALQGVSNVASFMPAMALTMMESMIPQARKGGACQSCLNVLQSLKNEIARKA